MLEGWVGGIVLVEVTGWGEDVVGGGVGFGEAFLALEDALVDGCAGGVVLAWVIDRLGL